MVSSAVLHTTLQAVGESKQGCVVVLKLLSEPVGAMHAAGSQVGLRRHAAPCMWM